MIFDILIKKGLESCCLCYCFPKLSSKIVIFRDFGKVFSELVATAKQGIA